MILRMKFSRKTILESSIEEYFSLDKILNYDHSYESS